MSDPYRPPGRTCFIIPTYNEAANIVALLEQVTALHPAPDTLFLVVDDDSPDGTAAKVEQCAQNDSRLHLARGPRNGLGAAYVRGMAYAIDVLDADTVIQMDADFSHNPADAGGLLAQLREGADVVIGSRYAAGGSIDQQWHPGRRQLSRWGNRLARWISGIKGVSDTTAGFKAIRATALEAANFRDIKVRGHAFQIVLLHRLLGSGARVEEIPIHFRDRQHGKTKLGLGSLLEFFAAVWRLFFHSHAELIKFLATGLLGVGVNLGSFYLLLWLGLHKFIASPIAIEISILFNFALNQRWTFASRSMTGRLPIRGLKFNLVSLLTLAISYTTFLVLSLPFPATSPLLLQACAILPAALLNFALNSRWTFRRTTAGATDAAPPSA